MATRAAERCLWLALMGIALSACASSGDPQSVPLSASTPQPAKSEAPAMDSQQSAAVVPGDKSTRLARLDGVLGADRAAGCLWIEGTTDAAVYRFVLKGDDYRVDFAATPIAVLRDGEVVAEVGDTVSATGGFTSLDLADTGCPASGRAFLGRL